MRWRAGAFAALLGLLAGGCRDTRTPLPQGILTVTATEQQASWIRNFNPLMPGGRWPSAAGIYEPLAIFNSAKGEWVPWLARAWEYRDGGRTVAFQVREGVKWSDGAPLRAGDVAFTFELLRRHRALDQRGTWDFLASVEAPSDREVLFRFQRVYVPGFEWIAHQPIVPAHAWSAVADPVTFTNPAPVATGPFTEVRMFTPQVYELGRNPHYWQPGKPAVDALRLPAFPGNDPANLALVDGELDWAGNYVPAIERVYVRRDPDHHRYWFPPSGSTVFLYANTQRAPYSDVRVRKAVSKALDRARIAEVAMSRYTTPSDATGLSAAFAAWRDTELAARADWTRHDRAAAERELDAAGLRRGPDGLRRLADGRAFSPTLSVVSGWSDWVRAAQLVARSLEEVGIPVKVRLLDQGAWFQQLQAGEFELSIAWSIEGATPYAFYRWLMHPDTVRSLGEPAPGNWHRHGSAAALPLFEAFERETDPAAAKALGRRLQQLFVDEAPAIPLFPNPSWGEFNSRRFEGFPDAAHPWAPLSPHKVPECLLVMTALRPVAGGVR